MDWEYNQYSLLSLIAGVISVTLSVYLWQRRTTPGAVALLLMMVSIAVWSLGSFLELGSTSLSDKIFWVKFQHLGMAPLPVAWLAFALQYTGRGKWLKGRTLALLSIIPLTTLILVWTNDAHHLFWRNLQLDTEGPFPMLAFTSGVWFWIDLAFSYLLISLGIFRLIQAYIYASHPYRTQAGILLIAAIAPLATNLLSLSNIEPFSHADTSPFAFTISGLALAWGLFLLRLLDIVPVARDAVIRDMPDGIIVLNTLNRIVDLNPAAERITGRSVTQIIGKQAPLALESKLLTPEVCGNVAEGHSEVVMGEGGTQRHYDLNISPVYDQRGRITGRLLTLHDTTERKQTEEATWRRLRFEETVSSISSRFVGVSNIDKAINTSLQDLGEFCGAGLSHLFLLREDGAIFSNTHEWCAQGVSSRRDHMQNLPVRSLPWWMGRLHNRQVICITDISQLPEEADTEKRMMESLGINSLFAAPLVIGTEPAGFIGIQNLANPGMWTENNLTLLRVSSEIIGNALERKWAEDKVRDANIELQNAMDQLKASQSQLLQSERLAAIGQLVAGVAHELNNPLMAVSGMTELMLMDAEDPIIREGLHTLQSDAERATAIVRNLLSFARKQEPEHKTISVNDVIESVSKLRSHAASLDNIRIMTNLDPNLPCIVGDFQQLQQVFLNFLINAEQAMIEVHGEGTITIRTQSIGESVRATVSDDGPGIPPDILGKIFEPFFTTKEVGKGTGLGLSICYGIIHEHGGDIWAESKHGEGATFMIELPTAPESAGSPCASSAPTGDRSALHDRTQNQNSA